MARVGKISVIPKDYNGAFPTMEKSLREKGYSRMPGTVRMLFPYKELNGKYRTGLDENAAPITKISDLKDRDFEQKRIIETREKLEKVTGVSLSSTSDYYNYTSRGQHHVEGVKLQDGDNLFNLDDPWQEITFHWIKSHPVIAPSLQAWERGEVPSDTQFYVNDDDIENEIKYRKKKTSNDAIIKFDSWSLEKRRKIAKLLDLPVSDDTKEEIVYNLVDTFLKSDQVPNGSHKGRDPIKVFTSYANLKDDVLYVKEKLEDTFRHQIYKERKGGRIFEGELEVFKNKDEMTDFYLDDKNQEDLLELEKKLRMKKFAEV